MRSNSKKCATDLLCSWGILQFLLCFDDKRGERLRQTSLEQPYNPYISEIWFMFYYYNKNGAVCDRTFRMFAVVGGSIRVFSSYFWLASGDKSGGKKGTMLFLFPSKSHPSSSSATPIFIETPPLQFILHSCTLSLCSIPRGKFFTIPCIVSGSGKQLLDVCFSRYGSSHE